MSADKARSDNLLQQMDAFQKRSFIAGAIFWTYQDYKSHRNLWPGQTEGYVDHASYRPSNGVAPGSTDRR